ncbi:kielin/chordin-like protein [Actinia tenebrosa]|uniref:Kielin/chordin-like protein n=1 Tax=Actinia tenebrosa TaxID=6105 RepID=A0A6P8GZQ6_ACTTE|nr:kielin/chordin-like protein [Actinia tenebrosa]
MVSCIRMILPLLVILYFISLDVSANQQTIYRIKGDFGSPVYIELESIGCFRDRPSRALRNMYANFRSSIRWRSYPDTSYMVKACAESAYQHAYPGMFAVQYYGECWSDGSAEERYNMYGVSTNCEHGVGKDWANMVYRYKVVPKPTSCHINGKVYNEGDQMFLNSNSTSCKLCTCSNGEAKNCKGLHCETDYRTLCLKLKYLPGQCCPVCECSNNGQIMPVGSTWLARKDSTCAECTCQANNVAKCFIKSCKCNGDLIPIEIPGKCCPKCVAPTTASPRPETVPPTTERPPPIIPPRPFS